MIDIIDNGTAEQLVGVKRHPVRHFARADSKHQTVYLLHSEDCLDEFGHDLLACSYSKALGNGINDILLWWGDMQDRPVWVAVWSLDHKPYLIPVEEVDEPQASGRDRGENP